MTTLYEIQKICCMLINMYYMVIKLHIKQYVKYMLEFSLSLNNFFTYNIYSAIVNFSIYLYIYFIFIFIFYFVFLTTDIKY